MNMTKVIPERALAIVTDTLQNRYRTGVTWLQQCLAKLGMSKLLQEFSMLALNPPLAALHGARLDHSGAVAHGFINTAEHLTAASLRLHNYILDCVALRTRNQEQIISPMLAIDVATDPSVQQMSAGIFQEQIHLAADLSTRWIALGEWHQHSLNAVFSHWLSHIQSHFSALPMFAGVSVLQKAVESADHAVSGAAMTAAQATEVMAEEAERIEEVILPRARSKRK